MTELTQFKIFLQGLVKPIIREAVEEAVKEALSHTSNTATSEQAPDLLNVKQAAEFLGIVPQTIYQNIDRIPHAKKHGRLYFRKDELLAYLEEGATKNKKGGQK